MNLESNYIGEFVWPADVFSEAFIVGEYDLAVEETSWRIPDFQAKTCWTPFEASQVQYHDKLASGLDSVEQMLVAYTKQAIFGLWAARNDGTIYSIIAENDDLHGLTGKTEMKPAISFISINLGYIM